MRKFTKAKSLELLKQGGVPVETIIDVGVQYGTDDLMSAYPDKHHILVESVQEYAQRIAHEYRDIPHTLISAAATNFDGGGFLRTVSQRDGETITHSFLEAAGRPVRTARVDTLVRETGIRGPYLLKIDVEGWDIPGKIVDGSAGIMGDTTVVICEMVTTYFIDIAKRIEQHGFALWDIVEACYYADTLWQTDAIFVRRDLLKGNKVLSPMSNEKFDAARWWPSYAD